MICLMLQEYSSDAAVMMNVKNLIVVFADTLKVRITQTQLHTAKRIRLRGCIFGRRMDFRYRVCSAY